MLRRPLQADRVIVAKIQKVDTRWANRLNSKSKTQLQAELKGLRLARAADGWVTVLLSLIRWGSIVLVTRYGFLAVETLSGQVTLAEIGIDFLGKVEVSVALAWTVGIVGGVYGWRQRKLRRDTVERLQARIQHYESMCDEKRSSSRLTRRGDSRPEDVA